MANKKTKKATVWWQAKALVLSFRQRLLWGLAMALLAGILYAPSARFSYAFDDDVYLNRNTVTQKGLEGIGDIFTKGSVYGFSGENFGTWRPITLLTFALEKSPRKAFQPRRSHLLNLLLYSLSVFVLFQLLLSCLGQSPWWLALGITALFAVHPLHTEVVANVKGREEILALLFLLLSLWSLSYWKDRLAGLWIGLAALSYVLAILSKENAFSFAPLFPLFLYLFTDKRGRKLWGPTAIMFALAVFFYWLRLQVLDKVPPGSGVADSYINNFVQAADGMGGELATILLVLGKYLLLLIFPHPLRFDYSYQQFPLGDWGMPLVWLSLLAYLAIGLGGLYGLRKRNQMAFGPLFYLITLSTAAVSPLLFRNVAALGERFLYTPSLGFCIVLGLGLYGLTERFLSKERLPLLMGGLGLLVLLGLIKTAVHLPVWQDNDSLFRYGVEVSPNSFRTHLNLAETQRTLAEQTPPQDPNRRPRFQEAAQSYERSLSIYDGEGTTWYNLGVCYMNLNQAQQAQPAFQKAIDRGKQVGGAANNIGVIYFQQSNFVEAARYFRQAATAEPTNASHLANLALALENSGQTAEAIPLYQQALSLDPNQVLARQQLGKFGY